MLFSILSDTNRKSSRDFCELTNVYDSEAIFIATYAPAKPTATPKVP